jgi:hypothetical protein
MFSRSNLSGQNNPLLRVFRGVLAGCVTLGAMSGCTLSPDLIDEYPAYGGIFQRMDQSQGRVGSVFSDPNLIGTDGIMVVDEVYEPTIISEEETIDAIIESDSADEKAFWRGRNDGTVEVIENDAEIVFEEEIH